MRTEAEVMYYLWKSKKYSWTQQEIANLFNCDVATVCRKIKNERWAKGEIVISSQELKKLYERLGSIQAVADVLLCGYSTVWEKLHKYRIPINEPGNPKHRDE